MNWENFLDEYLKNYTNEMSGEKAYNIFTCIAIVREGPNQILAKTQTIELNDDEITRLFEIFSKLSEHSKDKESISVIMCELFSNKEISIRGEVFQAVKYDISNERLFIKSENHEGIIFKLPKLDEPRKILCICLFSFFVQMQSTEGEKEFQNLGYAIRAVDKTQKFFQK